MGGCLCLHNRLHCIAPAAAVLREIRAAASLSVGVLRVQYLKKEESVNHLSVQMMMMAIMASIAQNLLSLVLS